MLYRLKSVLFIFCCFTTFSLLIRLPHTASDFRPIILATCLCSIWALLLAVIVYLFFWYVFER